ncbi:MAG: hypothetical protein HRU23_14725 [Gammaproteobacteria bacterium]|nr:hypothetical protein [Gammaproteobacteria bacterium]
MFNKRILLLTLLMIGWPSIVTSNDNINVDIIVVTSIESPNFSLQQIKKIYLGMNASGMQNKHAVTLPHGNKTRQLFHIKVLGLSEARVRSFWAQMQFSGRGKAPVVLATSKLTMDYLINNPYSIGYFAANTVLPPTLKVIYPRH